MGRFHGRKRLAWFEKSPGPAAYILPRLVGRTKHAVTHRINPEYSFGHKLKGSFYSSGVGPGPGNYAIPYGLKAKGFDAGLSYTMRAKLGARLLEHTDSPGPNIYKPSLNHKPRAPEFSIRGRSHLLRRSTIPGPIYMLGPMLGPRVANKIAAPEITLKGDWKSKGTLANPGPIYDVGPPELIKRRGPGFTMRIKWPDLKSQSGKAGPGSYDVGKVCCKPRPAWHFGIKHSDFTGVFTTECDKLRFDHLPDV